MKQYGSNYARKQLLIFLILGFMVAVICVSMYRFSIISEREVQYSVIILMVLCYFVLVMMSASDVKKYLKQQEKLEYLAYHDVLTALPNKEMVAKVLKQKIRADKTGKKKIAVVFLGLNGFKKINDAVGHQIGDDIIKRIGKELAKLSDENIFVGRFGGDEFMLLVNNVKEQADLIVFINQALNVVRRPYHINDVEVYLDASVGVSISPEHGIDGEQLIRYADLALYNAKRNKKQGVLFFQHSMCEELNRRMAIEQKLSSNVGRQGFELYYQPQFLSTDNRLRGFEALIRWKDRELGWISPTNFIPIAEETGKIIELGYWVLEEACKTWKQWKQEFTHIGKLAVNISAIQLMQPNFSDYVAHILYQYNISPSEIELEITESVLLDDIDKAVEILNELKSIGVTISLDDFGTGYSSLTYLKDLPIDTLKIDRSFISNILENERQREIADSLIHMVHRLNIETIAEGVETAEQYNYLKTIQCDNIQGFLTGRPMDVYHAGLVIREQSLA